VQPPPPEVIVAKVAQKTVPLTESYQGTTGSIESVEVRARVEGILESAPFKEGTLVEAGRLIFTLQKDKYQANVLAAQGALLKAKAALQDAEQTVPVQQAEANLAQKQAVLTRANITVKRVRPLAADKALPQKDLDNASQAAAQADVDVAVAQLRNARVNQTTNIESAKGQVLSSQADLDNAKLNLSYTDIRAPVTGLIGFLKYDVGNVVGSADTQVLDTITAIDPIKVNFGVDENVYLAIAAKRGNPGEQALRDQNVRLVLANGKTYEHPGYLYAVNPTIDQKTGTIQVEARFPNPERLIRPGQFARVELTVENQPNALLVPQEAIVQSQGVTSVFVVQPDDSVALRSVTLGPQIGKDVVVTGGLKAGESIVVQGTQKVKPGLKVIPKAA
jgi:membrane fusion protein (multidrug efflux system)